MNRRWQGRDREPVDLGRRLLDALDEQEWTVAWHRGDMVCRAPGAEHPVRIPAEWILDPRDEASLRTMIAGMEAEHGLDWSGRRRSGKEDD